MSVAPITAQELGLFAAIGHRHAEISLADMLAVAEQVTAGNCGAWAGTYTDRLEPADSDEIERWALDYLAGRADMIGDHFGPLAYNMVSNNGRAFVAEGVEMSTAQLDRGLPAIRQIEERCKTWQDGERRKRKEAEERAGAFVDMPELPKLDGAEVRRRMAGAERVIVAEYMADRSDSQSDYWGGSCLRTVIIGYGRGSRESFRQLRQAAGMFPPTIEYGPGRGRFSPRVMVGVDCPGSCGGAIWKGSFSPWHHELDHDQFHPVEFSTKAQAESYIAEAGEPHSVNVDGQTVTFYWEIHETKIEHRERYTGGGGYYLGRGRYSGWRVSSQSWGDGAEPVEVYEPTTEDRKRVKQMAGEVQRRPKAAPKPSGPFWTNRGLLSDDPDAYFVRRFAKQERAQEHQSKLRGAGIETEIVYGSRRNSMFLRLIETPTTPEPEPLPEVDTSDLDALAWM